MATLETRRATVEDAPVLAKLALELGYECDQAAMRHRLGRMRDLPDHAVFVAAIDGKTVVGWVHVTLRQTMLSKAFVEITGLVVGSSYRRLGIGKALMERAESWAERLGIEDVRVRTQHHRTDAHAFYRKLGYDVLKEQFVFHRKVDPIDPGATPTLTD